MLKHMLLFRVESESEPILVEQVVEESLVVSRFDIYGTDPEHLAYLVNCLPSLKMISFTKA